MQDRPLLTFVQTQLQILTAVVKLFLKKPDQSQGLVQKVLQAATAENDNPDVRDRAYVYWRLLSSDPQVAKNIVLSSRPEITSTIPVLSAPLLENLLPNLSTLASVYHKPPHTFIGHGRSSALQAAAIEEAKQNARENPIAAAAVSAAISGTTSAPQVTSNTENLLDIDFDGAAPASMQKTPSAGASGLEGLAGTPQRVVSPPLGQHSGAVGGGMDDLMELNAHDGGNGGGSTGMNGHAPDDLMDGFAGIECLSSHFSAAPAAASQDYPIG